MTMTLTSSLSDFRTFTLGGEVLDGESRAWVISQVEVLGEEDV